MAYGIAEDPARSPTAHLAGLDFPVGRDALARVAADNGAPADVINLFKSLPRDEYGSHDEVIRDFAEAARRFAMNGHADGEDGADRDRRNIGRDLIEGAQAPRTHHP